MERSIEKATREQKNLGTEKVLRIIQAELPETIKGATIRRAENHYPILLNRDQEQLRQLISLWHEVAHIWCGDLECDKSVEVVEKECREIMLKAARAIIEE